MGLRFALAAVLAAAVAGLTGSARADNPVLTGTVGVADDFNIVLQDANGSRVTHLDPGTYTLVVRDKSAFHNFHLFGPGVDVATDVDFVGDRTFTVAVTDGTYTYQCDPHLTQMKGTFTAGTVSTPPPAPKPAVTKLVATLVGSKAMLAGIASVSAGKAQVTVTDRSKADGFVLLGPGVAKKTGVAFTGKVVWTVSLRAGKYGFGSVKTPKARRTFTVSPA